MWRTGSGKKESDRKRGTGQDSGLAQGDDGAADLPVMETVQFERLAKLMRWNFESLQGKDPGNMNVSNQPMQFELWGELPEEQQAINPWPEAGKRKPGSEITEACP